MIKFIVTLIAFNFGCFFLFSQSISPQLKRCPVKTINFEQGLANNGTTNIITDALGFTWISAKTGMQRYNGYVLETINPVIDKQIISINSPVYFFLLQNGLIWVSYKQGILEYNPKTNSFKKIIVLHSSDNLNFSIIPVKETSGGIWCIQYKKGIAIYSHKGEMIKQISGNENPFVQNIFAQQDILSNAGFTANQNSIFLYNGRDQIQQFNIQTHQIKYIHTDNFFSFTCNNDNLYIISNNAITSININDNKIGKNISLKKFITGNITFGSVFLVDNSQLLISLNNRLFAFDSDCNYQREFTNLNRNSLASQGFIRIIYADRFKRIWLLTNDDIKRIQNFDIPFEHFIYTSEKNNFIRSIYYDEKKHILFAGCYNGGIQLYDTSGNPLWQNAVFSNTVKDINTIEKLTDDEYLIVTFSRGLYILNLPSKRIKSLSENKTGSKIDANSINFSNNVQRINDSTVFIATSSNIYNCVFKNEYLVSVKPLLLSNIILSDKVDCFFYAYDKTLWVGTFAGKICRIDTKKNIVTIHTSGNYALRSFTEDAQHHIWAGTDKGLYVYNNSGVLIKSITMQSGLLNDCIYALLPVKNKAAVFASSNMGLSYISLNDNIINYTKESGLQENEFNTGSAIKTEAGKYYFGGVNGITSFYPSSLLNINDTPVLNITKLMINDSSYNSSAGYWKGDSINLSYAQNHIQFDVAALGLLNTNEYLYKYRLNGFENNWQTTHEPVGIKYVLEPGTYLFELTCSPIFSSRSIFKRSITIIVSPPVWQTWWFKCLIIIISIAIIALIVRQYLKSRYQEKLNALQLTQEIQHERERISHDLHDNLGAYAAAIASNISTLQNSNSNTDAEVFNQLKNNSQSIINQLNDTIWALNKESIVLTAVSDRFKVFVQKLRQSYPTINIAIKENIVHDELLSPVNALHLFRIMQEAVNNALKHSESNDIFIEIISDKKWIIIIKDNGKGMPEDKKIFYGNGLNNIKARSNAAGWSVQWISEPQNGTEVIISATTN